MSGAAPQAAEPINCEIVTTLLTHARLQGEGYALRTIRFDANRRSAGRIIVGLVWRRHYDRRAEVRHVRLSNANAQMLLLSLGGLRAL